MSKNEMGDRDSQERMQRVNGKGDQTSCNKFRTLSADIAEIKSDLSLLWMKVINSETSGCSAEEDRNLRKENDLLKAEVKSLKTELGANKVDSNFARQNDKHMRQQRCFQKQLNEYREAERQKFYKQVKYNNGKTNVKPDTKEAMKNLNKHSLEGNRNYEAKHGKRKVLRKDYTGKSTKDIYELHELKQKLKTVEQERDSLRTVIEMLKADNDQCSEWQVIDAKTKKIAPTKGKNSDTTTVQREPEQNEPLQVSNQYASLDSNDVSCKTSNEAEITIYNL